MNDDIVENHVPSPVVGTLDGGQQYVVCYRRECAFHAGDVTTEDGEMSAACGKPSISWDADEGGCKDFSDTADVRPDDLEMARQTVGGLGAVGPWSFRIKGEEVVPETFLEASTKVKGLDPRFQDAVRELMKNEIAPGPTLSPLEEARASRDRNLDISTIIEAAQDAKPGDAIVFDELTGKARAIPQDVALAGGGPRMVGEVGGEEWVVTPLDAERATRWIMDIVEPSARWFAERVGQPALLKGSIEKGLRGRDIGVGIIRQVEADMESGMVHCTVELHEKAEYTSFEIPIDPVERHGGNPFGDLLGPKASEVEKGPEGEIVRVDGPEEFLEQLGSELMTPSDLVEVDGVVVVRDSMPGELKERVPEAESKAFMDAVVRASWEAVDELYFKEALKDVRCSDCAMRPDGKPTWATPWDLDTRPPPCLGKKKWQGINRACGHFTNYDADDYQGGEGFDEDDWNDSDWDRDVHD